MRFNVPDMSCGHCKAAIERAMSSADAAAVLEFDLPARTVAIDSALPAAQVQAVLAEAGYPAQPA